MKLKEKRDRLYKDYVKNGRKEISKLKFNKTKKIYEKMIKSKKETYYQNILTQQKYNMKNTWRTLNSLMGKAKKETTKCIEINGKLSYSPSNIANAFNDFFTNIPKKLQKKLPKRDTSLFKKYLGPKFQSSIFVKPTSINEVIKLLHDMKPKHSCGYDNLSPYIIKRLPFNMCKALVHIF